MERRSGSSGEEKWGKERERVHLSEKWGKERERVDWFDILKRVGKTCETIASS